MSPGYASEAHCSRVKVGHSTDNARSRMARKVLHGDCETSMQCGSCAPPRIARAGGGCVEDVGHGGLRERWREGGGDGWEGENRVDQEVKLAGAGSAE